MVGCMTVFEITPDMDEHDADGVGTINEALDRLTARRGRWDRRRRTAAAIEGRVKDCLSMRSPFRANRRLKARQSRHALPLNPCLLSAQLRRLLRQFAQIDLREGCEENSCRERLIELTREVGNVQLNSPPIPQFARKQAKSDIEAGCAEYSEEELRTAVADRDRESLLPATLTTPTKRRPRSKRQSD
jgi:hypothetical protein